MACLGEPNCRVRKVAPRRPLELREITELQIIANQNLYMLEQTAQQRDELAESLHRLKVATTLELERQRNVTERK